jgi:hypothetical protein
MANIPTTAWAETTPSGGDNISAGDNRIREMKTQIREVIDVDHDFPSSGQAADVGQHKKVTLQEQADLGTGAVGATILGSQTVSGKGELVYTDEDDNDIQITSGGNIDGASVRLDNNESLTATDNAGTGTVALIKANASDQAEITPAALAAGGIVLPEITAPTTAANQGGLYTKNDGTQTELYFREESNGDEVQITKSGTLNTTGFGDWETRSENTAYQAATDGFFVGYIVAASSGYNCGSIVAYSDSGSTPTTIRSAGNVMVASAAISQSAYSLNGGFSIPVKKGHYYKGVLSSTGTVSATYYWIPLGV